MTNKKKKNELEVITPKSKMLNTLAIINEKLNSIGALETSKFKTNGKFNWAGKGSYDTDIFLTTDLPTLIGIYGSLMARYTEYRNAVKDLQLNSYPVWKWQGYSFSEWGSDLRLRISIVAQADVINKLNADKEKLEKFLDKEDQLEITLAAMNYE